MLSHLKHYGGRFVLMIGGEVLQSAFHFAFNIALLRVLPARDYGLFALIMLIGGLALTYMRALAGMPASVTIPSRRNRSSGAALAVAFGSGAFGLALLIAVGVSAVLFPQLGGSALLAGAFVGLWSLRSYIRMELFSFGRPGYATISDVVFTGSGILLGLLLLRQGDDVLPRAFLVLALANTLAIAAALLIRRKPVRLSFGRGMRRRYGQMTPQLRLSCLGATTSNIQAQGQVLLIALLVGTAAYAPIAAVLVFYAPLRLIASALANMMQPELARSVASGDMGRTRQLLIVWTAAMLGVSAICCGATLLALPMMHAPVFEGQPKMLIGILSCGISTIPLLYVMPKILLEVLRRFDLIVLMSSVSGVVGMGIAATLLLVANPSWSLLGGVVSELMILAWCWIALEGSHRPMSIVSTGPSPAVQPRALAETMG